MKLKLILKFTIGLVLLATMVATPHIYRCSKVDVANLAKPKSAPKIQDRFGYSVTARNDLVYSDLPPSFVKALVFSEDGRFPDREGVFGIRDALGVAKSAVSGHFRGGSTLWMQTIRAAQWNPATGNSWIGVFQRKIGEVFLANRLKQAISKEELVALYANRVNFGGFSGLQSASWHYFRKAPRELSQWESWWLIGTVPCPARYSKPENEQRTLNKMVEKAVRVGLAKVADDEIKVPKLRFASLDKKKPSTSTFEFDVRRLMPPELKEASKTRGANINVTANLRLQSEIETLVSSQVPEMKPNIAPENPTDLLAGVVVIDVKTGAILAIVGSTNGSDQSSTATMSSRSIASAIKVFVAAAFWEEHSGNDNWLFRDEGIPYGTYRGQPDRPFWLAPRIERTLSIPDCLALSVNAPFVRMGMNSSANLNRILGAVNLPAINAKNPAEFLGTGGVKLIDLAAAYAIYFNGGRYNEPYLISSVKSGDAAIHYANRTNPVSVISAATATMIRNGMEGAIQFGTASAKADGPGLAGLPGAAKTGTSTADASGGTADIRVIYGEDNRFVMSLWIGCRYGALNPKTTSRLALPLAREIIQKVRQSYSNNSITAKR